MDPEVRRQLVEQHALFHRTCASLAKLMLEEAQPRIEAAPMSGHLDRSVYGLHTRAAAWAHSVQRLPLVFDIQAHAAACRSLLEIVIDLVLLTQGAEPVEMLLEWERLCKFREAEAAAAGQTAAALAARQFVAANEQNVAAAFTTYWPKKNGKGDPQRWTARPIREDAKRADLKLPRLRLHAFAASEYRRLCWSTHGSGLVLERAMPEHEWPGLSGLALHGVASMLEHTMQLALQHFGLFDETWAQRISVARSGGRVEAAVEALEAIARRAETSLEGQE
ncbi:MAG TPA: hypothetical protein VGG39_26775 [Polyangiaceae bacterium]|jgi:hypothetical protein